MILFTDLHLVKHIINPTKVCHTQPRDLSSEGKMVFTFHMVGPHVIPATVDRNTANRLMKELESQHEQV